MTLTEIKELFRELSGFVLVMAGGETIPVPRRLRSEVRRQYFDFYAKEVTRQ